MIKHYLKVPVGTQYIGNWKDYVMPTGHCIVDKGVTGCGYTEMCLTDSHNVILCSPRKMLLENKRDQHVKKGDKNILYLENSYYEKQKNGEVIDMRQRFRDTIYEHIKTCAALGQPVKFMITYDSAKYLIEYLKDSGNLDNYYIVADEFQSIFLDSFFKADIENNFVQDLQDCKNVIYLSATPMLDKYLEQVPEFANLDYYKIDWSESGYVETIKLQHKRVRNLATEAERIIQQYLIGEYPILVLDNGEVVQSKEAVLYFNSVAEILKIIKKCNLTPDQCNILCANDDTNKQKIKKSLKKGWDIGSIPLKGEQNKMFTFCTKTVYVGADFYSDNASTYIFADPNLKNLALDISLDLPQIAGRQRDRNNHFKNYITIFYKTLSDDKIFIKEDFNKLQEERRFTTNKILSLYDNCDVDQQIIYKSQLKDLISLNKYCNDFVGISRESGLPVYNKFIELADERAWEVSQKDYQDQITVTKAFEALANTITKEYKSEADFIIEEFLESQFYSTGIFTKKMKAYCEFLDKYKTDSYIMGIINAKIPDPKFKSYYNLLGTEGCKAKNYREDFIKRELNDYLYKDILSIEIYKSFKPGDKLLRRDIKTELSNIYNRLGINTAPKAIDINKWFEANDTRITSPEGKREPAYELLAIKKN